MLIDIKNKLISMQDIEYKTFHAALIPGVDPDRIIGIRIPLLREYAKQISPDEAQAFMSCLPHDYYEENNLHAFLIENISDYSACIRALNEFLPFVDNWATCDSLRPKIFKKHTEELIKQIRLWLVSDKPYVIRFALEMLMCHYLDDKFRPEYLDSACQVNNTDYYVKMMQAWLFSTALAKQYDCAVGYIEENRLDNFVHNKTIQKACESFRVKPEHKDHLRKYRK